MQTTQIVVGAAAFIAALLALAAYHTWWVRPELARLRAQFDLHDGLLAGGSGSAADRLAALAAAHESSAGALTRLTERTGRLEALAGTDVSRVGFVRYNALDDTGSDLSYALALLNRQGDGVVLSSIYSRTDTRTFGKAVAGFKPAATASQEELEAIERARTGAPLQAE